LPTKNTFHWYEKQINRPWLVTLGLSIRKGNSMSKKILGLDLGSNSIGWALLEEKDGVPCGIIDLGSRIFTKAVEEKTPTPKNMKRREARLARRVIQRRARRKSRMLNYLVSLNLLPKELQGNTQPEIILNDLGDPYQLRAKALDHALTPHELGRVFLHLVQRRGFLSNRKTLLGDMIDDPDVLDILNELDDNDDDKPSGEEGEFKQDIAKLRQAIADSGNRTLGEYLSKFDHHDSKRNRARDGGHQRTDRQMYHEELDLIWEEQKQHHPVLSNQVKEQIEHIIFYQRPLKLKADRVGKCSLETQKKRAQIAKLECQRFRYLQDINNLEYFQSQEDKFVKLTETDRENLKDLFEFKPTVTFAQIRKTLGFDKKAEFNLERGDKKLKGNRTACEIREVLLKWNVDPQWDEMSEEDQYQLVEDLLTITKKSALKTRLLNHWKFDIRTVIDLCLLEFESGHSNLSLKAIRKLLPYLEAGQIFSDARQSAGYGYEVKQTELVEKLGMPPETANPIVNKALHELRRVINALIKEHGKPDYIRIEMARDLEMNTKRYKANEARQKKNRKANEEATEKFILMRQKNAHLGLSNYPSRDDKIRYRLWKDQNERCAYSGDTISLSTLFSPEIDIDHIIPYSQSLDNSYMNKVVCFAAENRYKGQRTPIDAFGGNKEKWNQITQRIYRWDKGLKSKKDRFYMTASDVMKRDFISSQLNDTRYISKVALNYLKQLVGDTNVTVTKGIMTGWLRHQWQLNNLIGFDRSQKDRVDHRHHTIDALVTACIDRRLYNTLVAQAKDLERKSPELHMRDLHIDEPWKTLRGDLDASLSEMIVAHTPQRKISGALHEETGAGFIKGVGTVYRANLDTDFKITQVKKIIDEDVKNIIKAHLEKYNNKPKEAFAEGITVFHKDGKTPIKRVRIVQAKTTLKKLESSKLGIKDRNGKVFRWMAYGNLHHVEILYNKTTDKFSGEFVTTLEASHRARGIGMPKQPIIKTDHGENLEFVMALHINDLVRANNLIYRVQKLDSAGNRMMLRLHTAATISNKEEELFLVINKNNYESYGLRKISINSIGKIIND